MNVYIGTSAIINGVLSFYVSCRDTNIELFDVGMFSVYCMSNIGPTLDQYWLNVDLF